MEDPMEVSNPQVEHLRRSPFLRSTLLPSPPSNVHDAPSSHEAAPVISLPTPTLPPSDVHNTPSSNEAAPAIALPATPSKSTPSDVISAPSSNETVRASSFSTELAISLPKAPIEKEKIPVTSVENKTTRRTSPSITPDVFVLPTSSKSAPAISLLESPFAKEKIVAHSLEKKTTHPKKTSTTTDGMAAPSFSKAAPAISHLESPLGKEKIVAGSLEKKTTRSKSTSRKRNLQHVSFMDSDKLPPSKRKFPQSFQMESPVDNNKKFTREKSLATSSKVSVLESPVVNDKPTPDKSTVTSSKLPTSMQVESPAKKLAAQEPPVKWKSPEQEESQAKRNSPVQEESLSEKKESPAKTKLQNGTESLSFTAIMRQSKFAEDPDFPRDIFDFKKALLADPIRRKRMGTDADLFDIAGVSEISLPIPKLHRPGGYGGGEGDSSSGSQPLRRAS